MSRFVIFVVLLSAALFLCTTAYDWLRTRRHSLFLVELVGVGALLIALHLLFDLTRPQSSATGPPIKLPDLHRLRSDACRHRGAIFFRPLEPAKATTALRPSRFSQSFSASLRSYSSRYLGSFSDELKEIGKRDVFVCLNAFQNGFFWRVVYEKVENQLRS